MSLSKPSQSDVENARIKLETLEQNHLSVRKYLAACERLIKEIYGTEKNEESEAAFCRNFCRGLRKNIREIVEWSHPKNIAEMVNIAFMMEFALRNESNKGDGASNEPLIQIEQFMFAGYHKQNGMLRLMSELMGEFLKMKEENNKMRKENDEMRREMTELRSETREMKRSMDTLVQLVTKTNEMVQSQTTPTSEMKMEVPILGGKLAQPINQTISREEDTPTSSSFSESASERDGHKRKRIRSPEHRGRKSEKRQKLKERVIDVNSVLSIGEQERLKNGESPAEVIREAWQSRSQITQDISTLMETEHDEVHGNCVFCHKTEHPSWKCSEVTTIEERKARRLNQIHCCPNCHEMHGGMCSTRHVTCLICEKAKKDKRFIYGDVNHSRMMCPLQEEYWQKEDSKHELEVMLNCI